MVFLLEWFVYMLPIGTRPGRFFLPFCESSVDPSIPTLLCGDFNAVFDWALNRRGSNVFDTARESCVTLSALFDGCHVADVWCILHPGHVGFSWTKSDGPFASRIDLVGVLFPGFIVSRLVIFCHAPFRIIPPFY